MLFILISDSWLLTSDFCFFHNPTYYPSLLSSACQETKCSSKRSADRSFRSAVFCCQLATNRRPPKQVCGTQCVCGRGGRRTAEAVRADR